MIKIEITGDNAFDIRREMQNLLYGDAPSDFIERVIAADDNVIPDGSVEPTETPVMDAAPKRRGRPKKHDVPAEVLDRAFEAVDKALAVKEEAGTKNPTTSSAGPENGSEIAPSTAPAAAVEPLTKEAVKSRLMDLTAKIGAPKALALMSEKTGFAKFGDMPTEKYPEFMALIEAKLAEG